MHVRIAELAGDGVGPELMGACKPILFKAAQLGGHTFTLYPAKVGWAAYDDCGDTMPQKTWDVCHSCDCILFGAVGLPARDGSLESALRPEKHALLPMRKEFGLGCNIRPVRIYNWLEEISPLKNRLIAGGLEITFFRELIGGDYFGERRIDPDGNWAEDTCRYERWQIVNIARAAFEMARLKGQKVTSVDKANVLGATGTYWRKIVDEVHNADFTGVRLEHLFVDAFNAYLIMNPKRFQIVLTSNMFGDILSDGGGGLAGSLGFLPSASINPATGFGLYEPAAGSAPTIAGKGIANPIGMALSIAMMFRYTFRCEQTARRIEQAVYQALQNGYRTADLIPEGDNKVALSTKDMVFEIMRELE